MKQERPKGPTLDAQFATLCKTTNQADARKLVLSQKKYTDAGFKPVKTPRVVQVDRDGDTFIGEIVAESTKSGVKEYLMWTVKDQGKVSPRIVRHEHFVEPDDIEESEAPPAPKKSADKPVDTGRSKKVRQELADALSKKDPGLDAQFATLCKTTNQVDARKLVLSQKKYADAGFKPVAPSLAQVDRDGDVFICEIVAVNSAKKEYLAWTVKTDGKISPRIIRDEHFVVSDDTEEPEAPPPVKKPAGKNEPTRQKHAHIDADPTVSGAPTYVLINEPKKKPDDGLITVQYNEFTQHLPQKTDDISAILRRNPDILNNFRYIMARLAEDYETIETLLGGLGNEPSSDSLSRIERLRELHSDDVLIQGDASLSLLHEKLFACNVAIVDYCDEKVKLLDAQANLLHEFAAHAANVNRPRVSTPVDAPPEDEQVIPHELSQPTHADTGAPASGVHAPADDGERAQAFDVTEGDPVAEADDVLSDEPVSGVKKQPGSSDSGVFGFDFSSDQVVSQPASAVDGGPGSDFDLSLEIDPSGVQPSAPASDVAPSGDDDVAEDFYDYDPNTPGVQPKPQSKDDDKKKQQP